MFIDTIRLNKHLNILLGTIVNYIMLGCVDSLITGITVIVNLGHIGR
jgi:hypothetical protein